MTRGLMAWARVPGVVAAMVLPSVVAASRLPAQTVSVVVTPGFRPTAVVGPHVRYIVAVDSETGEGALRGLAVPPVVFGTVRIEGIEPFARERAPSPFADTVRFEPDGRVLLLRADAAGRPPIAVEVQGARGVAGGRLIISAPSWPLNRVLLVTVSPADIYGLGGDVGLGVRDRLRVDDAAGFAYLADSSAGRTTVAIGFGRGASGTIQGQSADVVVRRDYGGEVGRERVQVGALTLAIAPARDEAGDAHAEVVFGVGESEAEALRAARAAGEEPVQAPRAAALHVRTGDAAVETALRHVLGAAGWQLDWDVLGGSRVLAGPALRPAVRAVSAWRAARLAAERGDSGAVCGTYRLLRSGLPPSSPPHVEVGPWLGGRGRVLATSDARTRGADAGLVRLAYRCYQMTRDAAFLRREMPALVAAATRATEDPTDPVVPGMLRRLAELDDEMVQIASGERVSEGDSLRALAAQLEGARAFATPAETWGALTATAHRSLSRDYGRLADAADSGFSLAAAGDFVDAVGGGLFGLTEHLDHVDVSPSLDGVADSQLWELTGWLLAPGDTLDLAYRPADQAARIRLAASRGWWLTLRFPWLTGNSCVQAIHDGRTERLPLRARGDGSGFVDVPAAFNRAEIRVAALPCAPG